jgi:small GTP-binding protein
LVKVYPTENKRIVFIGKKSVGKSSLINAFLEKDACGVDKGTQAASEIVEYPAELHPSGSVILVDAGNIDDQTVIKQKRIDNALNKISSADFVIVVLDAREKLSQEEKNIFSHLKNSAIPFVVAVNKIEYGINSELVNGLRALNILHFEISCKESVGIDALKARITRLLPRETIANGSSKY